ncbi:MAG TPA: FAD-dependent oxidoreductase [Candidatus Limnocylindrales bacterium]|nr:FAD-dependent oxidoreductase [Candidatus Limnocylindrales bacterium]
MIRVYGTTWCGDCKRAKKFLGEHRVPYQWTDIDQDEDGQRIVIEASNGKRIIPTIFFDDGTVLIEPSNVELARQLGLKTAPDMAFYDVVVVGGGPAGLTAALYSARDGYDVLVIDQAGLGGQAGVTEKLDNFPGFPEGIGGAEFADRLVAQCKRFGVELLSAAQVTGVTAEGRYHKVSLSDGSAVNAAAVLLTPGSTYRRLGVPGEEDFIGAGVHFCATCDGPFYRGQEVLVIGGGNSATEEAVFLTRYAGKVTILARGERLTASAIAIEKAEENPKISILYRSQVAGFTGDGTFTGVSLTDGRQVKAAAAFVFVGLDPNTAFLRGVVDLSGDGFIVTSPMLQTSLPGVFAAGDARAGSTKQLVSAAGEGATAALMIRNHLQDG